MLLINFIVWDFSSAAEQNSVFVNIWFFNRFHSPKNAHLHSILFNFIGHNWRPVL